MEGAGHVLCYWTSAQVRQNSEKLGKSLTSGVGKLRQTAEHNGQATYSQVQMGTRVESPGRAKLEKQGPHPHGNLPPLPFLPGDNI